jgi:hypothetical protein
MCEGNDKDKKQKERKQQADEATPSPPQEPVSLDEAEVTIRDIRRIVAKLQEKEDEAEE